MKPTKIHFIWMGMLISDDDVQNVIAWRDFLAEKAGYSITPVIWTDRVEETIGVVDDPGRVNALVMSVTDLDKSLAGYRNQLTTEGALGFDHVPTTAMWDGLCEYAIDNRKLNVFGRNYGISSDIYRMVILHEYGGIYMDCDNTPRDIFVDDNGTLGEWDISAGKMLRTPSSGNSSIVAAQGAEGPLKALMYMAGVREGLRTTIHEREKIEGWAELARKAGENWLGGPCQEAKNIHAGWLRLLERMGDDEEISELDLQRQFTGVDLEDLQKTPGRNSDCGGPFWNPRYKFTTQVTGPSLFDALDVDLLTDDIVDPASLEIGGWVRVGKDHAWA